MNIEIIIEYTYTGELPEGKWRDVKYPRNT